ncbi:MAG: helix-turn-helix domain-containing protein [Acidaminococcaceae bacterium]
MDIITDLMYFNLTRQEATIYLTLLTVGQMTGYEAAKQTGVSRSNTYTALAGLVDKGAAYMLEDTAMRYTAVPADEFCTNRIRQMQACQANLLAKIPTAQNEVEGYITIKGAPAILHKLKNMIAKAQYRLYVSAATGVLGELTEDLQVAVAQGRKVVIITEPGFQLAGAQVYFAAQPDKQIRLIADSAKVLTGDLEEGANATCLYSGKHNLVDLFKDALKNEIKLIELTQNTKVGGELS